MLRCLKMVTVYTRKVRDHEHFLGPKVTFDELRAYSQQVDRVQVQNSKKNANPPAKLPLFTVSIFSEEAIEGCEFMEEIERVFASNVVTSYLTSQIRTDLTPWHLGFASR